MSPGTTPKFTGFTNKNFANPGGGEEKTLLTVPAFKEESLLVKMNTIEEVMRSARSGETEEQSQEKLKQISSTSSY